MGNSKKIAIILGTRPEIIKFSPLIRELEKRRSDFFIIHTNQHYDKKMDEIFFKELDLPLARFNLNIGSGTHGDVTGRMLSKIEEVLIREKPEAVLVEGDTNTVLAGALAASKLNIPIGHIEAGLRSFDKSMPEETNRILTDHCSYWLFSPTQESKMNLIREGILNNKIHVTGNTIVDSIFENVKLAKRKSNILKELNIKQKEFFLVTAHRQENVDNYLRLKNIFRSLDLLANQYKLPIIYPIHPRTRKKISEFKITPKNNLIKIIDPVGYLDFLCLEIGAKLILTDSGGVQEEACILKVPCLTLRDNTERPETLHVGANFLSGTDPKKILRLADLFLRKKSISWKNPFGKVGVSKKIITMVLK